MCMCYICYEQLILIAIKYQMEVKLKSSVFHRNEFSFEFAYNYVCELMETKKAVV